MAKPFVIIFLARSGSTALYGYLRKHADVVMKAEIFGAATLPNGNNQTDDNRVAYLREYWAPFAEGAKRPNARSRGFKWQIDWKNTQFEAPMRLVDVMNEYNPRVIILQRENILKQAVSSMNAQRLLQFTANSGTPSAHITLENAPVLDRFKSEKMILDLKKLDHMIAGIKRSRKTLCDVAVGFSETKIMKYEDFARDARGFIDELCAFIGIDSGKIEGEAYMKITSDDLADVVENYDELRSYAEKAGLINLI